MESEDNQSNIRFEIEKVYEIGVPDSRIEKIIKHCLERFAVTDAMVSLTIVDNDHIQKLNKKFLRHDHVTDVISFDLSEETDEQKVFEIIINGQLALKEAQSRNIASEAEFALYIVHALLHNLGFDDLDEKDAMIMHRQEDDILQELGYGIVYNTEVRED